MSQWVIPTEGGSQPVRRFEFAVLDKPDFVEGCVQLAAMAALAALAYRVHQRAALQRPEAL